MWPDLLRRLGPFRSQAGARWRSLLAGAAKVLLTATALAYAAYRAFQEGRKLELAEIDWLPALGAGACYVSGLLFCAAFWYLSLRSLGSTPHPLSLLTAYFTGHLAKYLPGKVWVVVARTSWPRGRNLTPLALATTATQETLLMMGVGGVGGCVLWYFTAPTFGSPVDWGILLFTGGGGLVLLVAAMPIAVGWALRLGRSTPESPPRLRWRVYLCGLALMSLCWGLLGLSLLFATAALPDLDNPGIVPSLAAVAVATAAGFLTFLPGGLGSRELTLAAVLASYQLRYATLLAAMLRAIWVAAELACWIGCALLELIATQRHRR